MFNGVAARLEEGGDMDGWTHDLGTAARGLLRRPAFTAIAVLTLALGIGGNTAIYSIVDAAWVDALPYPDHHELVVPYNVPAPERGGGFAAFSAPFYTALRDAAGLAAVADVRPVAVNVGGEDRPERIMAARVSASFFDVAGVPPALGRFFTDAEAAVGGPDVAVLAHGLWTRRFAADPGVVGRDVLVDGRSTTVVGVMPDGFELLFEDLELWLPGRVDEAAFTGTTAANNNRVLVARLPRGGTIEAATARLPAAVDAMRNRFPDAVSPTHAVRLVPLRDHLYGSARGSLTVLMGAVGLVLLIACANLANLLLVRGEARRSELAVRAALGAGRARLARTLMAESLLLAVAGGGVGLALGSLLIRVVAPMAPSGVPLPANGALDGSVILVTGGVALLTALLFGMAPAWSVTRTDLRAGLVDGGRGGGVGGRPRARSALVVGEVALTAVLLVGSGLLLHSLWRLQTVDPGFGIGDRTLAPLELARDAYPTAASAVAFHRELTARVGALPGVAGAGLGQFIPLTGASNWGYQVEGATDGGVSFADYTLITPGYLEAMDQRVVQGRGIEWADADEDARPVVLVSEAMAERLWPGEDPLGRRINVDRGGAVWREVVGVVSDVRNRSLADEPGDILYFPPSDVPMSSPDFMTLVVHHPGGDPPMADIRGAVASLDPAIPMTRVRTLDTVVRTSEGRRLFMVTLLGLFAAVALVLAAVGLYGVVSWTVALRTREIGLRMAVGAGRGSVLSMVAGQSAVLVGVGLVLGFGGAVAASRLLGSLLYGVGGTDPVTYGAVAFFLTAVAALATWVPAARAASVDPASVLKS